MSNSSLQFLDVGAVPALPDYSEETLMPTEAKNVYSGPSDKYVVVGSINKGEQVTRLSSPALNTGDYSFIQYATAEGTKRGYVNSSGLVPYVPPVPNPDPVPVPEPNPDPEPDPDPDDPKAPEAGDGEKDWSFWYVNAKGLPSPFPPHDTPKDTPEEQYAFNDAMPHFKDKVDEITYNTIVTGGEGKTEAEFHPNENLDWGLMQINAQNSVYFQRKDLFGNIITNWHANARVGIIFIRDAYLRIAKGQRTIALNGEEPSADVVKATYQGYNAGSTARVPAFYEIYTREPKHWYNDTGLDPGNDPLIMEHPLNTDAPVYSYTYADRAG